MDAVRLAVIQAIRLVDGFEPANMENFGLRADLPLTVCRDKVRESAVFLSIIGVGKTTVTLGVLHDLTIRAYYGEHRFFAALETANDRETMRIAIVVACGLDPRSARFEHALAHLAKVAPALLVLDNLETPLAADPRTVEDDLLRLAQIEGLAMVVSRRGTEPPGGPDWVALDPLLPLRPDPSREPFLRWASRIRLDDPDLAPLLKPGAVSLRRGTGAVLPRGRRGGRGELRREPRSGRGG